MKAEARAALEAGDLDRALALWARATSGDAAPADLLEHAVLLHHAYRSQEAGPLWNRLLEHPRAATGELLAAARVWFQARRFGGCARFTGRALEISPDSPDIAALHASALERSGEKDRAMEIATAAIARHPGHVRLIRQAARIERSHGRFVEARERLERQLRTSVTEDDWRLRYELAAVLDRMDDAAGAMRELEAAKGQLAGEAARHRPVWRAMAGRQWEITGALDSARLARWSAGGDHPPLCLMAGFPRSGTTLLEQVLTRHPGCLGTDESGVLATQFRDPIVFAAASSAEAVAELDGYEPEDLAAGRDEYFRCTRDVLGEAADGRLLIEKDPLLTADMAVPLRLFPRAKVLMPLRDPRDVVVSYFFTIVPAAPNSVASATLEETCRAYGETMRHWLHLRERLDPARWSESRYEGLLEDPGGRTRELADFLSLEWSANLLDHRRPPGERAVGTPTYDDVTRPLYTRARGRWQRYAEWLEPHLPMLEPYLRAFGYA